MERASKLLIAAGVALAALVFLKRGAIVSSVRAFIADVEGFSLTVYQDTGGVWTVGYGHKVLPKDGLYPYTSKREITQEEADTFYANDSAIAERAVTNAVRVPLTENQRAALVSLAFNIGAGAFVGSTLVRKLNAGDIAGAADEFLRWVYDNGVRVEGLANRRERERELFLA